MTSLTDPVVGASQLQEEINRVLPHVEQLVKDQPGKLDATDLISHLAKDGLNEAALRRAVWYLLRSGHLTLTEDRRLSAA